MSTRTHEIIIEVEDNDDIKTASDLASLAAGAAEFIQNALPDNLDVTSVRTSTSTYEPADFLSRATFVTPAMETFDIPFDPTSEVAQQNAKDAQ
jgi:hypothetical protein